MNWYQRFCRCVEENFCCKTVDGVFYLWGFLTLVDLGAGILIAESVSEAYPNTIWPILVFLFSFWLAGWLFLRSVHACFLMGEKESRQRHIEKAPLNWERFESKADKSAPVLDFEIYERGLIYSKLTPWQQVMGDRNFLCGRLKPSGWEFQEFQAQYDKQHNSFRRYEFHFKRGETLLCIEADLNGYDINMEKLQKMDEIAEIGIYQKTVLADDLDIIRQVRHYLEGDKYG